MRRLGVRVLSPARARPADGAPGRPVDICLQSGFTDRTRIEYVRAVRTVRRCPSGQREQTVNLPAYAYRGSNPLLPTPKSLLYRTLCSFSAIFARSRGGSSSVGRASAFQAEGRGFESRFPLQFLVA